MILILLEYVKANTCLSIPGCRIIKKKYDILRLKEMTKIMIRHLYQKHENKKHKNLQTPVFSNGNK